MRFATSTATSGVQASASLPKLPCRHHPLGSGPVPSRNPRKLVQACASNVSGHSEAYAEHIPPCCSVGLTRAEQLHQPAVDTERQDSHHTSGPRPQHPAEVVVRTLAVAGAANLLLPGAASAAEALPLQLFNSWLVSVDALGPWGPVIFIATVATAEMIPLFPTQPLSLASGLLFGTRMGAVYVLTATALASMGAFYLSRGIGRPLAERIIKKELDESSAASPGVLQSKLSGVYDAIERGSFWQQFSAIFLLRLTPVVPYSASSYLLGLTPLSVAPYVSGTLAGMAVWSTVYASLGGASRALLKSGTDPAVVIADLAGKAGQYSETAARVALAAGLVAFAAWAVGALARNGKNENSIQEDQRPRPEPDERRVKDHV